MLPMYDDFSMVRNPRNSSQSHISRRSTTCLCLSLFWRVVLGLLRSPDPVPPHVPQGTALRRGLRCSHEVTASAADQPWPARGRADTAGKFVHFCSAMIRSMPVLLETSAFFFSQRFFCAHQVILFQCLFLQK